MMYAKKTDLVGAYSIPEGTTDLSGAPLWVLDLTETPSPAKKPELYYDDKEKHWFIYETNKRHYVIADKPGHLFYMKHGGLFVAEKDWFLQRYYPVN